MPRTPGNRIKETIIIAQRPNPFGKLFIKDLTRSRDLRVRDFSLEFNTPFFCALAGGREYGAWMTAGRITTIADTTVTAASAIENVVGVIESIVEDDLNSTFTISVDTDNFDAAYDDRPADGGWICDISIFEQIKAFDLIDDLCLQFHLKRWFDWNNDLKVKAYNTANSVDYTFVDASERTDLQESLNYGRIFGSVNLAPVDIEAVYNDFVINYGLDYGSGKFKKIRYLNASEENFTELAGASVTTWQGYCTNANDRYHINKKFIIDAPAIQDDETAENSLKEHIIKRTQRPYLCSFVTGPEGFIIELGDFINIQSRCTKELWATNYATKKWDVYSNQYLGQGMFEISAIEVNT